MTFQCEKTGCTALIAGRRCHGDLFRWGDGYLMRVSSYCDTPGKGFENWMMHAEFDTYIQWWGRADEISTVVLPEPVRYSYVGLERFK